MKKILTVLLILAVSAGTLFAQIAGDSAFKLTGNVKSGIRFHQEGAGDPTLGFWNDDAGPIRAYLEGSYEAENHGLSFGFYFKPAVEGKLLSGNTYPIALGGLDYAKLWGDILDDKVRFTVGYTGGDWGTGGRLDVGSGDANIMVNIKPITGLSFGFHLGDRGTSWYKDATTPFFNDTSTTAYTPQEMLSTFGGGVKYEADGGFITIAAGGRIVTAKTSGDNRAYLGATIKPIGDPLVITAGAAAYGLADFNDENKAAKIKAALSGEYKTDGDNAGSFIVYGGGSLMLNQYADAALGWSAELNADYWAIDTLKVGVHSSFWSSEKDKDNGWEDWHYKDSDYAVAFEVQPRITFKLASNAEIGAWYRLNVHAKPDDNLEHNVQVNFSWSF
ncbi:hypothetical protein FACS189461_3390 [Spirochaetia bacterium]|nr:hypothetical protein FACS189461_3390 [Spirochaetia bacterium]